MLMRILFLIFLPTLLYSQELEKIQTINLDSFENISIQNSDLDFLIIQGQRKNGNSVFLRSSLNGENISPSEFDAAYPSQHHFIKIRKGNLFGFANTQGEVIVPIEFDKVPHDVRSTKVILEKEGQWIIYDHNGNSSIFPNQNDYTNLEVANDQTIIATNQMRVKMLIDFEENMIKEEKYSRMTPVKENEKLFRVGSSTGSSGLLSSEKGIIVPLSSSNIIRFHKDIIEVGSRKKNGLKLFGIDGSPIDPGRRKITSIVEGLGYIYHIERDNFKYYGLLDDNFQELLPAEYTKQTISKEGFIIFYHPKTKNVVINSKGEEAFSIDQKKHERNSIRSFSTDDLILNKTITEKKPGDILRKISKKASYWINGQGELILKEPFEKILPSNPYSGKKFANQPHQLIAVIRKDSSNKEIKLLYNRKGEFLQKLAYEKVYYFTPSLLLVEIDKKFGLINQNGKMVLPIEYDRFLPINYTVGNRGYTAPFFRVNKDDQSGIIDLEGNFLIPMGKKISSIEWLKKEYLWVVRGKTIEIYKTLGFD